MSGSGMKYQAGDEVDVRLRVITDDDDCDYVDVMWSNGVKGIVPRSLLAIGKLVERPLAVGDIARWAASSSGIVGRVAAVGDGHVWIVKDGSYATYETKGLVRAI